MNTKALWAVLIIVIVLIGAWYAFAKKDMPTAETETGAPTSTPATSDSVPSGASPADDAATVTVTYQDTGFSPGTVTVNAGDTVRFVNQSSRGMWVAADEHPTHTEYDGTALGAHCPLGGSFDQCRSASAGGSFEFTFTKAGTFSYHNHVRAADNGTVTVR